MTAARAPAFEVGGASIWGSAIDVLSELGMEFLSPELDRIEPTATLAMERVPALTLADAPSCWLSCSRRRPC